MGALVKAVHTPWALPWDHRKIILNFDGVLRNCGVKSAVVRRRMTINAVTASGWKQNCFCYNAFGVQLGGWRGDYFVTNTFEYEDGVKVHIEKQPWRAFDNFFHAVSDWLSRMQNYERYEVAWKHIADESVTDGEWWVMMGKGGYYTAPLNESWGDSLGKRIEKTLAEAKPGDFDEGLAIDVGNTSSSLLPIVAISLGVIGLVLILVGYGY